MKRKDSKETVCEVSTTVTKKNRPRKIWVNKGTEIDAEFKKLSKAEGLQNNSSMSETKAAFTEHTIRPLKIKLYRYIEDYGYKYIHKLSQFVTTLNSRKNAR